MWKQSHKTATYPERKSILTIGRRLTAPASVEKKKPFGKKAIGNGGVSIKKTAAPFNNALRRIKSETKATNKS